jgi:RNA polymerase sigma-70 factor (ECF subfamily)
MGSPDDFEAAFVATFDEVHRYIYRRLGRDAADDLTAETFAIAFARWHRFDASRPVRPWLFGIATNLLRHHYRDEERKLRAYARTGVDSVVELPTQDVMERADAQALGRVLANGLAELRRQEREVLLLRAWAELSDEEIAAALNVPLGTAKTWLSRGRRRLRNLIGDCGQSASEATRSGRRTR